MINKIRESRFERAPCPNPESRTPPRITRMYKLLLCWRYLLTRYIALASIVSVMLGVATMIIVNAVMLGFTSEMQNRIHGILADVIFESRSMNGFADFDWHRRLIVEAAGDLIEEVTPTIVVPAMLTFRVGLKGEPISMPIELIGIDAETQGKVTDMTKYLQHPQNRKQLHFGLRNDGYDVQGAGLAKGGIYRYDLQRAGLDHRRFVFAELEKERRRQDEGQQRARLHANSSVPSSREETSPFDPLSPLPAPAQQPENPFDTAPSQPVKVFDPAKEQHAGIILGVGLCSYGRRYERTNPDTGKKLVVDDLMILPGDDVTLTFPTADLPPKLRSDSFTVVDIYESKMVEYDSRLAYVPIEKLQQLRGMIDPASGKPMLTQILIKAKPGANINELRDRLRAKFPPELIQISTWRDKQESLLAAVFNELAILNVLLFLIFAVAGFGILAIFYMIVVEKTKDIGILKSLGAGGGGIMQIFLYYSLLLGVVGASSGLGLGLVFIRYIKEVAAVLSIILQHEVFDPAVYSFYGIPTIVQPWTVFWIIAGAIVIAVASGILPAARAARMHPVESLRS